MRLFFFNLDMDIPPAREIHSLIPAVIFSVDPVIYASTIGTIEILMEHGFLDRHPQVLLKYYKGFFSLHHGEAVINDVVYMVTTGLKLEHKKMRTKEDFILIAKSRKMLKFVKDEVFLYLKYSAELNYLEKVNPYARSKNITLTAISRSGNNEDIKGDENNTEDFIKILTEEHDYFFCTEDAVKDIPVLEINDDAFPENFLQHGIFKTDILNLPGCVMLRQGKLALLRDELQPSLREFQTGINKLQDDVKELTFAPCNFHVIREKTNSLLPVFSSLRKKCDDSIYLNQLSNNEWGEYRGSLSLAIASRHSMVHSLKKTGQMSEVVFDNLISNFTANNLLDKTVLFFLHDVPEYPPQKETILREEIDKIWNQSYET